MRLRYLYLPSLPPLQEIEIHFGYEPVLGQACALHFVVGVNGSGKSRLLRALAEIFLCMERGIAIPFDVTLVYDLGPGEAYPEDELMSDADKARAQLHHTIYLHRTEPAQTLLIDFDYIPPPAQPAEHHDWLAFAMQDWEHAPLPGYRARQVYRGNNPPSSVLPKIMLAYTSGAVEEWETLFAPRRNEAEDILMTTFNNVGVNEAREQERPPNWDNFKENELQRQQAALYPSQELYPSTTLYPSGEEARDTGLEEEIGTVASMGIFVPPRALKLAICAVVLKEAAREFSMLITIEDERNFLERIQLLQSEGRRMTGVRGLLNEIGWLWPVTIGLRILFRPELLNNMQLQQLLALYKASTTVIREPEPGKLRHLYFDLHSPARDGNGMTIDALIGALSTPPENNKATAFDLFQQLLFLQQQGILEDVIIALRKQAVNDLILYEGLSDGEQVFLGRMAFFHLLQGTEDALILLDEPETHFNDYWKREMVDIIDSSLRDDTIEVLLSTHSSIALTDAFDTEITLLYKVPNDGGIFVEETPINSFGASPIDIMRKMFYAPESVGQRAAEFLDLMLMIAIYPEQVQIIWALDTPGTTSEQLRQSDAFHELRDQLIQRIPHALQREENPTQQIDRARCIMKESYPKRTLHHETSYHGKYLS